MNPKSLCAVLAALLLWSLPGCAGGWRNGPPPGAATAQAVAPAARPAAATAPAGTHATAEGVLFVWTGGGNSVNVAGEFNAWSTSADPMQKQADGSFTLAKPLAAGRYPYKFVVNGTDWKPDPGATESVDDGFGGKNSVVVVGGAGTAATALPAAAASAPAGKATHATADGALFVWSGGGNSVNVAGEFNAWSTSADPMQKQADGSFTLAKPLAAGRYPYKFVVNGTDWKPDPSATEGVDDGFGGKNSVIVVGAQAATSLVSAPVTPAASAPVAAGAGTRETADGALFVWSGGGNTVNVAGEFNAWSTSADPMQKQSDGSFTLLKKLAPGRYPYKFVVNATDWKPDPAAQESVDDGYGGKNSLIVLAGGATATAPAASPAPAAAPAVVTGKAKAPAQSAAGVTFTCAQSARTVHLAGDFNGWSTTADPLARQSDGTWTLTKKLAPGVYAYKFILDGTTWKTDDANPAKRDDGFGGTNSVVTVK